MTPLQNISTSDSSCSDEVWAEAQPWTFLAIEYALLWIMADSRALNQQAEWGSMSREKSGSAKWEKVYEALKYIKFAGGWCCNIQWWRCLLWVLHLHNLESLAWVNRHWTNTSKSFNLVLYGHYGGIIGTRWIHCGDINWNNLSKCSI